MKKQTRLSTIVECLILAILCPILCITCSLLSVKMFLLPNLTKDKEIETTQVSKEEIPVLTIIKADSKTFECVGETNIKVSEVGIVEFSCIQDLNRFEYMLNPTNLFIIKEFSNNEKD